MLPAILLLSALSAVATPDADRLDLDFDDMISEWIVVVDGVMGGRSTGQVARSEPGVLRFSGDLSLENNGGFSQIRREVAGQLFSGTRGIEITVRGDGRAYDFDVRCANARVMAGGFQQTFETSDGAWTTIFLPFDNFRLYSFGRPVAGAPDIAPSLIESIGVTLSDKMEGPFRLEIASIRAVVDETDAGETISSRLTQLSRRSTLDRLRGLIDAGARERTTEWVSATASAEAARLTELAIHRGVPLFNDGQPAACAAVYEVTIEAMVALGAERLGTDVVERLKKGLAEAKANPSSSERAWTYRRTLDDVYRHLARQAAAMAMSPRADRERD